MALVLNVQRLNRKLRRLTVTTQDEVRTAMEEAADAIVATAKNLVPVKTGRLRGTIGWTWGDAPRGAMVLGQVGPRARVNEMRITIYAGDESTKVGERAQFQLARLQEFGTQNMPANPFFYVSYRAHKKSVKRRIRAASRKAARRVSSGG